MSIDVAVLRSIMNGKEWALSAWEPQHPIIVVGRGGILEKEIRQDKCREDNAPIYRRRTGGGAVVLSPGMLVFSLGRIVGKPFLIREYAGIINRLVIEYLQMLGIKALCQNGISDICIGDRKIMGSGMYRRGLTLFFQGSIMVSPDLSLMERYLDHPPKEPDYRKGRKHGDFVTSLKQEGYDLPVRQMAGEFSRFIISRMGEIY